MFKNGLRAFSRLDINDKEKVYNNYLEYMKKEFPKETAKTFEQFCNSGMGGSLYNDFGFQQISSKS